MIRDRHTGIWQPVEDEAPHLRDGRLAYAVLIALVLLFAFTFSWLSVARHAAFQSHAFDLGNMQQAVWNTLHGRPLRFTDMTVGHSVLLSRLAIHVEPLLVIFAPLYLINSGPETLLISQALIVSTGAIPAYFLARDVLGRVWLSLAFPLAYLLHPSLQNALLDDFHAVVLSAALLFWSIYFLYRRRPIPFLLFAVLSAATKEEVGLIVAGLGLWAIVRSQRFAGLLCLGGGLGWFLVCITVIIPHFNPAGHSPYLSRYGYLGEGLEGVVRGAVTSPGLVWRTLLSAPRLDYLLNLTHSLGFTPFLSGQILVLAAPVLLINLLSADPTMYSGFYQYSAEIVPLVVTASIVGVGAVQRRAESTWTTARAWIPRILCGLIVVACLLDSRIYGFTPFSVGYLIPTSGPHQRLESRALSLIPPHAVVAAADEMEPHVAARPWVYVLPTTHPRNGPRADYLVLDASVPSLPVTPRRLSRLAVASLRHGYGVKSAADGILLLQRGNRRRVLPASFYSFIFRSPLQARRSTAQWGALRLRATVVHPRSGSTNRSRPAISVETYWRTARHLSRRARISFYLSPVYSGRRPRFSQAWIEESDSPTWDWLPLHAWPRARTVRCDSLSFVPASGSWGTVDVAVAVSGMGPVSASGSGAAIIGPQVVRVGSVAVRP